jgi:hypothetical protein
MSDLEKAAQAVLVRWDSPAWQRSPAGRSTAALMADLRRALAAHKEQTEPVAWLSIDSIGERYLCFSKPLDNDPAFPLYARPPQQAEPVAEPVVEPVVEPVFEIGFGWLVAGDKYPRGTKLYAALSQQQAEPVQAELTADIQMLMKECNRLDISTDEWVAADDALRAALRAALAQQQAEPVVMQYIALCDAMRYSEREDEELSPEEYAESLVAEIDRLRGIVPEVLERLNDELCEENDRLRRALAQQQAEPVGWLRDLLINTASTAVAAERQGRYPGAARVADWMLEEHPQQAEPVADGGNPSF